MQAPDQPLKDASGSPAGSRWMAVPVSTVSWQSPRQSVESWVTRMAPGPETEIRKVTLEGPLSTATTLEPLLPQPRATAVERMRKDRPMKTSDQAAQARQSTKEQDAAYSGDSNKT